MNTELIAQTRLQARLDAKRGATDEAIALLNALGLEHPDISFDLALLYLKKKNWKSAVRSANAAIIPERSPDEIYHLLWILIVSLRGAGTIEQLRSDSRRFIHLLQAAVNRAHPNIELEPALGLKYWQGRLNIAFGTGDTTLALEVFRQRDIEFCPIAAAASSVCLSPTLDLKNWCQSMGARYEVVQQPNRVKISSASSNVSLWDYETDEFVIAVIPDGEFLSGWDFVRTPTGEVLYDSGYVDLTTNYIDFVPHSYLDAFGLVGHIWPDSLERIDEDALFLSTSERFHVGHWIVDFLPRLRALNHLPNQHIKLAIPTELPEKQIDFLGLFGIPSSQLIQCDVGKRYSFRTLTVVRPGSAMRPNPDNVRFIANAVRLPSHSVKQCSRLFITRGLGTRNIVNRAEMDLELSKFGFEYVNLATMSVAEQRARFADAEIVIAIYGSDVLALFFMFPESDLIELKWNPKIDGATGPYCSALGINYHTLIGDEAAETKAKTQKKDRDFNIDCRQLRQLLESIIARKTAEARK